MGKPSKKSSRPPRKVQKHKTGFEKLVEQKDSAKNKKIQKLNKFGPANPQGKKETKVVTSEDIGKKIAKKLNKKSLFDIESDDEEQIKHMRFVEDTDDLAKTAELERREEEGIDTKTKQSKQDRFKNMIKNSKKAKFEKTKMLEEQRETIEDLNTNFAQIANKLVFSSKEQVKKDANEKFSSYYSILNSMKKEELLKAEVIKKPKVEKLEAKKIHYDDDSEEGNENDEEMEEEEIEKRELRGYKQKKELQGLENTLNNLKGILKNKRDMEEEEDDEDGNCAMDGEDYDEEDDEEDDEDKEDIDDEEY